MADTGDTLLKSIRLTRAAIGLVCATAVVLVAIFAYAASFEKRADAEHFEKETAKVLKEHTAVISTNSARIDDVRNENRDFRSELRDEVKDIHREIDYVVRTSYETALRHNPDAPKPPVHIERKIP